jgi:hypothetical protein
MTRAERFLQLHKELETQLRSRLHLPKTLPYSALLDQITDKIMIFFGLWGIFAIFSHMYLWE